MYISIYLSIYIYIYICICMLLCLYIYIYIYISNKKHFCDWNDIRKALTVLLPFLSPYNEN